MVKIKAGQIWSYTSILASPVCIVLILSVDPDLAFYIYSITSEKINTKTKTISLFNNADLNCWKLIKDA